MTITLQDKIKQAAEKHAKISPHAQVDTVRFTSFSEGATFLLPEIEKTAVEFVEWAEENYIQVSKGKWIEVDGGRCFTTAELYKIFTDQANKSITNL